MATPHAEIIRKEQEAYKSRGPKTLNRAERRRYKEMLRSDASKITEGRQNSAVKKHLEQKNELSLKLQLVKDFFPLFSDADLKKIDTETPFFSLITLLQLLEITDTNEFKSLVSSFEGDQSPQRLRLIFCTIVNIFRYSEETTAKKTTVYAQEFYDWMNESEF